jgi:microcystin-dependent protein
MQPFLGMIALFGFNFDPVGWEYCRGQLLAISQYDALFALIGTTYGGDGVSTFALPDFRSRVAIGQGTVNGTPYVMGQRAGVESMTLTTQNLPAHNHTIAGTTEAGDTSAPQGAYSANTFTIDKEYKIAPASGSLKAMNAQSMNPSGNTQPFPIIQPVLALNYCIAVAGIFPSQN